MNKQEINKWLSFVLRQDKPSKYFELLKDTEDLEIWFPELKACIDVPQNPKWHPEGDVWTHTMMTLDQAASLRNQAKHPYYFMIVALMHDYGKATTTAVDEKGVIHSIGHEFETHLAINNIKRLMEDPELISYATNMISMHMRPNALVYLKAGEKAYRKLFNQAKYPEDLLLLSKADHYGRLNVSSYDEIEKVLQNRLVTFQRKE